MTKSLHSSLLSIDMEKVLKLTYTKISGTHLESTLRCIANDAWFDEWMNDEDS